MDDTPAAVDGNESDQIERRPDRTASPQKLPLLLGLTALAVVITDQVSKAIAVAHLTENVPRSVVRGILDLHLIRNPGAAFSLATGNTWIFTVIAIVVTVLILRLVRRVGSRWWAVALGLLLGGAVGNLVDRLVQPPGIGRGHVIDFLELPHWPIFNVADSCIVSSAVLIAIIGMRGISLDGSHASA